MKLPEHIEKLMDDNSYLINEGIPHNFMAWCLDFINSKCKISYKDGFNSGFEQGLKHAVGLLKETYPKDNDGPFRSGGWFADWLESEMGKMK